MTPEPQFPMHIVSPAGAAGSASFEFANEVSVEADRANPRFITALHARRDHLGHSYRTYRATYLAETIWPGISWAAPEPDHAHDPVIAAMELGRWVVAADYLQRATPGTITACAWGVDLAKATLAVEAFFPFLRAADASAELLALAESTSAGPEEPLLVSNSIYKRVQEDYMGLAKSIDPEQFAFNYSAHWNRDSGRRAVESALSSLEDAADALLACIACGHETSPPARSPLQTMRELESAAHADLAADMGGQFNSADMKRNTSDLRAAKTLIGGTLREGDVRVGSAGHSQGKWRARISVSGAGVNELELWMKAYDNEDVLVAMSPVRWPGNGGGLCAFVLAPETSPRFVLTDTPHLEDTPAWLKATAQGARQAGSTRAGKTDRDANLESASHWIDAGDSNRAYLACQMGLISPEHRAPYPAMISLRGEDFGLVSFLREAHADVTELTPWEGHFLTGAPSTEPELERLAAETQPTWARDRKFWAHDQPFIAEEIHAGLFS
jgi:hypothetical protein